MTETIIVAIAAAWLAWMLRKAWARQVDTVDELVDEVEELTERLDQIEAVVTSRLDDD